MEYIYGAMLLHSAKKPITEENLSKIFKALDIDPDEARVKALVSALSEVNIDEVLKSAFITPPATVLPASPAEAPPVEKKEEKKKEEERPREAVEGLSALFG